MFPTEKCKFVVFSALKMVMEICVLGAWMSGLRPLEALEIEHEVPQCSGLKWKLFREPVEDWKSWDKLCKKLTRLDTSSSVTCRLDAKSADESNYAYNVRRKPQELVKAVSIFCIDLISMYVDILIFDCTLYDWLYEVTSVMSQRIALCRVSFVLCEVVRRSLAPSLYWRIWLALQWRAGRTLLRAPIISSILERSLRSKSFSLSEGQCDLQIAKIVVDE